MRPVCSKLFLVKKICRTLRAVCCAKGAEALQILGLSNGQRMAVDGSRENFNPGGLPADAVLKGLRIAEARL